jgi:basic membrane protein A
MLQHTSKVLKILTLMLAVIIVIASCAPATTPAPAPTNPPAPTEAAQPTTAPATTAPEPTAASEATAAPSGDALKVGLVTDVGGPDDKSFNFTAIEGLNRGVTELGISPDSKYLQSRQETDYAKNLEEFIGQDYDGIITVGFLLGTATATSAKANPDINYAIVDYAYPDCFGTAVEGKDCGSATEMPNVLGLTFRTEQAAMQAGYLAAAVSKTKKVGTYGGINIPPVVDFMVGFQAGVNYWNSKHNDTVELLGWDTTKNDGVFTATFTDPEKGKQAALSLIDEGADIVLPVAGLTGNGTFTAAQEKGTLAIGVDVDQCISIPEACPVLLTSVQKNISNAVFEAIKQMTDGSFKGGVYSGTFANDGVEISDYHENADKVTPEVQAELDQLKQDIIDGKIDIKAWAMGQGN